MTAHTPDYFAEQAAKSLYRSNVAGAHLVGKYEQLEAMRAIAFALLALRSQVTQVPQIPQNPIPYRVGDVWPVNPTIWT